MWGTLPIPAAVDVAALGDVRRDVDVLLPPDVTPPRGPLHGGPWWSQPLERPLRVTAPEGWLDLALELRKRDPVPSADPAGSRSLPHLLV
ncbi:MAG: hypothetical protein H6736_13850 [Alphaproteobacteria bacterium]|nr:hypothetical protein [Alphaproteobacteria bacterium]